MTSLPASARTAEATVSRWIDAFNARDLGAMLACLDREFDFHPLKLLGLNGRYRGHGGVEDWLAGLGQMGYEHRIALSEVREADPGQVLAGGALSVDGRAEVASFCGLHQLADGLIVCAHHFLSDPGTLEWLGRLPSTASRRPGGGGRTAGMPDPQSRRSRV